MSLLAPWIDENKKPKLNWYCEKCKTAFHFELPKEMGEMQSDERPRCPYCGSFATRKL